MNPQEKNNTTTDKPEHAEQYGGKEDALTMNSPEAFKPGNAGTKFKREARRKVLTSDYEQQLRALWGDSFRLYSHANGVILYFDKPKQIRDDGSRVSAKNMEAKEAAQKLVAMALAKGWKGVSFTGEQMFVKEAMRQAMLAGLEVVASDMSQAALLDEVKAEVAASMLTATMEPASNDLLQRLFERRQKLGQVPSVPADQSDSPRQGPSQNRR